MKILVFSPYYPPHIGGLESHSDEFNKYLSLQGVDITVFTPRLPITAPEQEIRHNNVKIIRFPAFELIHNYPMPKFWSPRFWQLFRPLFKERYDIAISRTRFFFLSFMTLIYSKLTQTYWIHIEHGSDFVKLSSKTKTFIAELYDRTIGWLIFRLSDENIAISEAVQRFIQRFDARPTPIIYRGIDFDPLNAIRPNADFKKQYAEKFIVGVVARLYKWKGIEQSICAIQSLPKELQSRVIFVIIGDGEDFQRLQNISDPSLTHFLGNLPREQAISILKTFDIYIHSSLPGGGLSTSLLEAMQSGCAIIATPNEGAREVIEDRKNGILIENGSSEAIRGALITLLESKKLREGLGKQAIETIETRFSWEKTSREYLKIFDAIKTQS